MNSIEEMKRHTNHLTCPVEFTRDRIAGKWKLVILWHIYDKQIIRYGELKNSVHGITHKMLSSQLKELIEYNLVHKELYHQVPPKTEYSLTEQGESLIPILKLMYKWGKKNMKIQTSDVENKEGK